MSRARSAPRAKRPRARMASRPTPPPSPRVPASAPRRPADLVKGLPHFAALRRVLGLGKVLLEDIGDGSRFELRAGEDALDHGTVGASIGGEVDEELDDVRVAVESSRVEARVDAAFQRKVDEELDDVCVTVLCSTAESVVSVCANGDSASERQIEKKLDNVRSALPSSVAQRVVVVCSRIDAPLQRQIEEKLDDVRVAILGSKAQRVVLVCARIDAQLRRQLEKKPSDVCAPESCSDTQGLVGLCARIDVALFNKNAGSGSGVGTGSSSQCPAVALDSICHAEMLQDNVSVLDHVPVATHSSARRHLPAPTPMAAEGVDLVRPEEAVLRKDGDS